MNTFLYVVAGFAVGFEAGRLASGRPFQWKKAIVALLVAAVLAWGIAYF